MAGGMGRKEEGSLVIKNSNVFAALETLKKKKKKSTSSSSSSNNKDKGSKKSSKSSSQVSTEPEPQVFWQPTPLNTKSWADVDDDEDDDYYATAAPPASVWGHAPQSEEQHENVEDTESDDDLLDEGEDDIDDEHDHDHEPEAPASPEPVVKKVADVPSSAKDTERQLSKKERKKKELAELEALLADFGVASKESDGQDMSHEIPREKKNIVPNDEGDKKENTLGESKSAKKKKKKDKSNKEAKEPQEQPNNSDSLHGAEANGGDGKGEEGEGGDGKGEEGEAATVDIKGKLKKVASVKKKKSNKEMDAAAKVAAQEAAARSTRLAAAKKKEKKHYNQQPVR